MGVNSDLQLETEPETPWKPKSQVAILDCLEAIRVALIFIEYAPESDIDDYFAWWHRLVRSRPNKIDQLMQASLGEHFLAHRVAPCAKRRPSRTSQRRS